MSLGRYIEIGRMDELGRMDTSVHRLDARAKIVATAVFIVVVMSFPRYEVSGLVPLFAFPFVLMAAGNIPVLYILRKVAVAAPFALCVGAFNPLMDRQAVGLIGSHPIAGGWFSFASILVRFALTVSAALVLISCTGIHRLCSGLERMGLPRAFAVQILFLYRYFFVVGDEGVRMVRSVALRGAGRRVLRWRTTTTLLGNLLLRSMDRAQRVYRCMVARGFDGNVRVLRPGAPGWRDAAFVVGWVLFFVLVRLTNVAHHLGRWVAGGGA